MTRLHSQRPRGYDSASAFIYALADPRAPHDYRYVGRTTLPLAERAKGHVQTALSRLPDGRWRNAVTHKIAWIRALARDGYRPIVVELAVVPRETRIVVEQQWIAALREAGYRLTNATSGGEGPEQYKATDQTRTRQSAANRRRFEKNPAEREFFRLVMRQRYAGEEGRRRLSEQTTAQWARPGAREAHGLRLKEVAAAPGMSERRSAAIRAVHDGPRGAELRAGKSRRVSGERNPSAKLTWEQVCSIRARYVPRVVTHSILGAEFGVTPTLIGQIIRGLIWATDPTTGEKALMS